jgi:hypothetical protein
MFHKTKHTMFAFSKFTLRNGENPLEEDVGRNSAHSHCGFTLLGWWNVIAPMTFGKSLKRFCYWGERIGHLNAPVVGSEGKEKAAKVPALPAAPGVTSLSPLAAAGSAGWTTGEEKGPFVELFLLF